MSADDKSDEWRVLAARVLAESDPVKLVDIIAQLDQALIDRERQRIELLKFGKTEKQN
jgi:hypothetical protein